MAQVATMGPPLSPRETRRSGRRSAPSGSTSTSKSPDSPSSESAPRLPTVNRSSSSASSRKRTKQEDLEDPLDDSHKNGSNGTSNSVPPLQNGNGRTKRKGKEKEKPVLNLAIDSIIAEGEQADVVLELSADPDAEEEEQGVTRCVCGNAGIPPSLSYPFILPYHTKPPLGADSSSRTRSLGDSNPHGEGDRDGRQHQRLSPDHPPSRTPVPDRVPAPTSVTHSHISVINSSRTQLLTFFSQFTGDDDESAGEFFVQCEMCNVWQHGQCMGIRNEDAVKADHYFCEQCRPDLHVELLKYAAAASTSFHSLMTGPNVYLGDSLSGPGTVTHPPIPIQPVLPGTASPALILRPIKNPRNGETP